MCFTTHPFIFSLKMKLRHIPGLLYWILIMPSAETLLKKNFLLCNQFCLIWWLYLCVCVWVGHALLPIIASINFFRSLPPTSIRESEKWNDINLFFDTFLSRKHWNCFSPEPVELFTLNQKSNEPRKIKTRNYSDN